MIDGQVGFSPFFNFLTSLHFWPFIYNYLKAQFKDFRGTYSSPNALEDNIVVRHTSRKGIAERQK